MKIALVGSPNLATSENAVGGAETWTAALANSLVERGHDVTLFACEGSQIDGTVVATVDTNLMLGSNKIIRRHKLAFYSVEEMAKVVAQQSHFDLIHLSVPSFFYYLPFTSLINCPVVATFHAAINFDRTAMEPIFKRYPDPHYVFISHSFAHQWPSPQRGQIIYNGVDTSKLTFADKAEDFFFWIGRVSPEKGLEDAIVACKKAGKRLVIAGGATQKSYFDRKIKPLLHDNVEYLQDLTAAQKLHYFQNARALLMPIKWEEPFGLVVAEAMACGTPVIAYKRGAMPEIIKDKETGYLIEPGNLDLFTKAIDAISDLDLQSYSLMRSQSRQRIEQYFSHKKMVDSYEMLYERSVKKVST